MYEGGGKRGREERWEEGGRLQRGEEEGVGCKGKREESATQGGGGAMGQGAKRRQKVRSLQGSKGEEGTPYLQ